MPGSRAVVSGFGGTMGPERRVGAELADRAHREADRHDPRRGRPDFDINLDLNFHFKPEACMRIARAHEPFNLHWLELDNPNADAVLQIKQSTSTRILHSETLIHMQDYLPFFQRHARRFHDRRAVEGFAQSKKVGDLRAFQHNVARITTYSHLSASMSANLCAVLRTSASWRSTSTMSHGKTSCHPVPEIVAGHMKSPRARLGHGDQ